MKKLLTAAIALSVLAGAGAASAQSYGYPRDRDDRGQPRAEQRYDRGDVRRDDRRDVRDDRRDYRDDRRGDRRDARSDRRENRYERRAERRYDGGRYYHPRGYQARDWRRGERLPAAYRGRAYAVDYRAYRLSAPPRGYEYRRVGDDVVLTAITTGIIVSVLFGLFN
ncbi:MAG: RcnB family protein [Caulobacter sp.]|nr:RcnB family protein [Caulobacter sp.]